MAEATLLAYGGICAALLVLCTLFLRHRRSAVSSRDSLRCVTPCDDTPLPCPANTGCLQQSSSNKAGPQLLWDVCAHRGFLPSRAPLIVPMDPDLAILATICAELPFCIAEQSVVALVASHTDNLNRACNALKEDKCEDELECCHALYSYIVCAFALEANIIPSCLATGFCECARRLNRRPMLDYSGCVLYNWELIDPNAAFEPANVRMLRRFTGLIDEEWFFKTHLIIEAAAGPAIAAIADGSAAVEHNDVNKLAHALAAVEHSFGIVAREKLPLMFERDGWGALCDYSLFFHRLRPLISGAELTFQGEYDDKPVRLPGPSGAMSTLLPALDAFLGVSNSNHHLHTLLAEFALSMPKAHRDFLASVRSARPMAHASLLDGFDRCVDILLDFRWRHLHMVRKYIVDQSASNDVVGTGGTPALEYLHQHIADTELAKLSTRRPPSPPRLALRPLAFARRQTKAAMAAVTSRRPTSSVWHVDAHHGLCPASVAAPHEDDDLTRLARAVPSYAGSAFRTLCDTSLQDYRLADDSDEARLETQRVQLAFVCAAYARCDGDTLGDATLPPTLARLLNAVSKKLDRAKKLSLTDLVTYNAHGARLIGRFLAVPEETALYTALHKAELETPDLVAAILRAEMAVDAADTTALGKALDGVRAALRRMAPASEDDHDDRIRHAVMRRLRPFLVPAGAADADLACLLYCGADASALLACLWRFLGVPKATSRSSPLQFARDALATSRASPPPHRQFALERHPAKLREAVVEMADTLPVHEVARLEAAYNGCLDHLLAFCVKRAALVCSYLPDYASHFMRNDFQPDRQAILAARLNLLFDRRRRSASMRRQQAESNRPTLRPTHGGPVKQQQQLVQLRPKARPCPLLAPPPDAYVNERATASVPPPSPPRSPKRAASPPPTLTAQ